MPVEALRLIDETINKLRPADAAAIELENHYPGTGTS
jgi:hypothetical protein